MNEEIEAGKEPTYIFPRKKADVKVVKPEEEVIEIKSDNEQLRSDVDFLLMLAGE